VFYQGTTSVVPSSFYIFSTFAPGRLAGEAVEIRESSPLPEGAQALT
jgi:hypothetical protein